MDLPQPSFIKNKARRIEKEKGLKWSKALDEASKECGFNTWKSYLIEADKAGILYK